MKLFKKYPLIQTILVLFLNLNCSNSSLQSHEQNSYFSKTSIQINLTSENLQQQSIKEIVIELKNKSRSFNYFGVTDSNGTVIFKDIVNDDYDLFISGNLNQNISIKKNKNIKVSVKI